MRGDEARVVDAFVRWLEADGWAVEREIGFADVRRLLRIEIFTVDALGYVRRLE